MLRVVLVLLLTTATAAHAAEDPSRITVTGLGSASTPPDRATVAFTVHGEGASSDEAVSALVTKRRAIDAGLARYAGAARIEARQVTIGEVRGRDCNRNSYGNPRLSTGECAIIGYLADISVELTIGDPASAATLVGLIGRLGGTSPRVERFYLADESPARERALADALSKARITAAAIAKGAGVVLGPLLSASEGGFERPIDADIVVTGMRLAPPAPPPPPPPVPVDIVPKAIETQARVTVSYAIAR